MIAITHWEGSTIYLSMSFRGDDGRDGGGGHSMTDGVMKTNFSQFLWQLLLVVVLAVWEKGEGVDGLGLSGMVDV